MLHDITTLDKLPLTATFHNGHVYNCTSVVIIKYGAPNKKMNAQVACYQNPLVLKK